MRKSSGVFEDAKEGLKTNVKRKSSEIFVDVRNQFKPPRKSSGVFVDARDQFKPSRKSSGVFVDARGQSIPSTNSSGVFVDAEDTLPSTRTRNSRKMKTELDENVSHDEKKPQIRRKNKLLNILRVTILITLAINILLLLLLYRFMGFLGEIIK